MLDYTKSILDYTNLVLDYTKSILEYTNLVMYYTKSILLEYTNLVVLTNTCARYLVPHRVLEITHMYIYVYVASIII